MYILYYIIISSRQGEAHRAHRQSVAYKWTGRQVGQVDRWTGGTGEQVGQVNRWTGGQEDGWTGGPGEQADRWTVIQVARWDGWTNLGSSNSMFVHIILYYNILQTR